MPSDHQAILLVGGPCLSPKPPTSLNKSDDGGKMIRKKLTHDDYPKVSKIDEDVMNSNAKYAKKAGAVPRVVLKPTPLVKKPRTVFLTPLLIYLLFADRDD